MKEFRFWDICEKKLRACINQGCGLRSAAWRHLRPAEEPLKSTLWDQQSPSYPRLSSLNRQTDKHKMQTDKGWKSDGLLRVFFTNYSRKRRQMATHFQCVLVVSITENRSTDTKPNTNENHGKIPKPNQPQNMWAMTTFYRIDCLLYIS